MNFLLAKNVLAVSLILATSMAQQEDDLNLCTEYIADFFTCKTSVESQQPKNPQADLQACFIDNGCTVPAPLARLPPGPGLEGDALFQCAKVVGQRLQNECQVSENLPIFPAMGISMKPRHGPPRHGHGFRGPPPPPPGFESSRRPRPTVREKQIPQRKPGFSRLLDHHQGLPGVSRKDQVLAEVCDNQQDRMDAVKSCFEDTRNAQREVHLRLKEAMDTCHQNLQESWCASQLRQAHNSLCSCVENRAEREEEVIAALSECDGGEYQGRTAANQMLMRMCRRVWLVEKERVYDLICKRFDFRDRKRRFGHLYSLIMDFTSFLIIIIYISHGLRNNDNYKLRVHNFSVLTTCVYTIICDCDENVHVHWMYV